MQTSVLDDSFTRSAAADAMQCTDTDRETCGGHNVARPLSLMFGKALSQQRRSSSILTLLSPSACRMSVVAKDLYDYLMLVLLRREILTSSIHSGRRHLFGVESSVKQLRQAVHVASCQ